MQLNDDEQLRVQEWLDTHLGTVPPCPMCHAGPETWEYSIYTPLIVDMNAAWGFRPRRWTIELACATCAYLLTFNAVLMDVKDRSFDEPPAPPPVPPG